MLRIKVCGLTDAKIARDTAMLGVDAIGLVFCQSPRKVDIEQAIEIAKNLPPFVSLVGLFANSNSNYIDDVLNRVPLNVLQFHGDESAAECRKYQMPFIKSVAVKKNTDIHKFADTFSFAKAILLDSYNDKLYGGSGETFAWDLAKIKIDLPIILAGGLTPDNISDAVKSVNPYAVDVSSGVESAKGIKDTDKILNFIKRARL